MRKFDIDWLVTLFSVEEDETLGDDRIPVNEFVEKYWEEIFGVPVPNEDVDYYLYEIIDSSTQKQLDTYLENALLCYQSCFSC